jgi:hypothetical protein
MERVLGAHGGLKPALHPGQDRIRRSQAGRLTALPQPLHGQPHRVSL